MLSGIASDEQLLANSLRRTFAQIQPKSLTKTVADIFQELQKNSCRHTVFECEKNCHGRTALEEQPQTYSPRRISVDKLLEKKIVSCTAREE